MQEGRRPISQYKPRAVFGLELNKPALLMVVWGLALTVSAGLHWWGLQRPEPLQTSWTLALLLVFAPAVLLAAWLLVTSPQLAAGETRESDDCDQETH